MKKLFAIIMCVMMVMCFMPSMAFADGEAQVSTWDGATADTNWYNDSNTNFTISTAAELAGLAKLVNKGTDFTGKTITLDANIDLGGKEWTPIGDAEFDEGGKFTGKAFLGTFDGNGKTISNLVVNKKSDEYIGLFGIIMTPAEIKNLTLDNVYVIGKAEVGGLLGSAFTGTVKDCNVTGPITVTGNYKVGGLAGEGYANIDSCSVKGASNSAITATYSGEELEGDNVGGLIGFRGEGNISITGCKVENLNVSGTRKVGGIVGSAYCENTITNCTASHVTVCINATNMPDGYIQNNSSSVGFGGIVGLYNVDEQKTVNLIGCIANEITLSGAEGVKMGYITAGQRTSFSLPVTSWAQCGNKVTGNCTGANLPCVTLKDVYYPSLEEAVEAAQNEGTIKLLSDCKGGGIIVGSGKNITIDFNNHTYTIDGTTVGSTGTQTNGFQLLKGSTIKFENGKITSTKAKILIQNYCDLTLDNMTLDGSNLQGSGGYVLSNNCGKVNICGNTSIKAGNGGHAFDVCWAPNNGYPEGTQVTLDTTGEIAGNIEFGLWGKNQDECKSTLTINNCNMNGKFVVNEELETAAETNIKINGGTFSTDPSEYVAPGYVSYQSGNNWIVTASYVPSTPEPADPITNHDETAATEGQTGTTPTTTADLSKDTASKTETKTETVTNEAGQTVEKTTQTTTVAPETAGKIVEKAVENKSEEVVLDATTAAAAEAGTQTQVVIPATTVQQIVEKTDAAVTVKTDAAEVTLDAKATEAIAEKVAESGAPAADETVAIVVEKAKESDTEVHFELSVVTSNGKVSDFKGGIVTVTVPVSKEMAAKELVCVYIAEDGTVTKVPGKLNADGTYTFTTGHFSTYAIMTVEEADKALDAQEAKLVDMVKAMKLKARSVKTAKGSIKVTAAAPAKTIKALKDAGYTVKYKFYRSTKKASKYAAKLQKTTNTYINTTGKKGVRYYYKAIVKVYDEDGKLVANTSLKNCRYACRVK